MSLVTGGELRPRVTHVGAWTLRALRQSKIDIALWDVMVSSGRANCGFVQRELEGKKIVLGEC